MIIGFSWGGWVTGGTSRTAAATAGDVARGELASAICVEQVQRGTGCDGATYRVQGHTDSYKKRQFVEAGGWATMPGQTTPDSRGVEGCATALAV